MNETREKILSSGVQVLLEKGYNGAGLKEILAAAGVPKGSFYHFFKSKEEFGKQVLDVYSDQFKPILQAYLIDSTESPLERLQIFFDAMIDHFDREQACKGGCLVGNLAQELADVNESMRTHTLGIMDAWTQYFQRCLDDAKREGQLPDSTDTKQLGEFILNSWEGALLKMKVETTTEPLKVFSSQLFQLLKP